MRADNAEASKENHRLLLFTIEGTDALLLRKKESYIIRLAIVEAVFIPAKSLLVMLTTSSRGAISVFLRGLKSQERARDRN